MAYKLLIAVSLVFFISHASCGEVQKSSIEEIQKQFTEAIEKAAKALGITESDKLYVEFKKSFSTFSTTFSEYAKKFEGDAKPLIEQAQAIAQKALKSFNDTIKQIQSTESQSSILKLQEDFLSGVKKLTEQGSEVVKSLTASSPLPDNAKNAVYDFLSALQTNFQNIQKKAQEFYNEAVKGKKA